MEEIKVVLITGGSSGIGAATARILADHGMKVYAASRRGKLQTPMPDIIPISMDVNDWDATRLAVAQILRAEGRLDAVVVNAGSGIYGPVEGTLEEEARHQFETNYFGAVKTIQACLPVFREQGHGRIITVCSVMSVLQLPFQGFYSSVKAALLSLSESLSMELKGSGIQCSAILPGDVATGFTSARKFTAASEDPASPYRSKMDKNIKKIEADERGGMQPEVIGKAILKQLKRKKMRVRVIPRLDYAAVGALVRLFPEKSKLALINFLYT